MACSFSFVREASRSFSLLICVDHRGFSSIRGKFVDAKVRVKCRKYATRCVGHLISSCRFSNEYICKDCLHIFQFHEKM